MILFDEELNKFIDKVKELEPFSLVRFHDGENYILRNRKIDLTEKANGEFKFDPNTDNLYRQKLIGSLKFKSDNYYVGIMSGCCVKAGVEESQYMKQLSEQDDEHMTFATLFFNSNYERVRNELIPLFKDKQVIIICNKKADVSKLPFQVIKSFSVGTNAWVEDYTIIDDIKSYIEENKISNTIFLFCAGPLSNILIRHLHQYTIANNSFINLGSVLDEYMFNEPTRWYHTNKNGHTEHTCIWN